MESSIIPAENPYSLTSEYREKVKAMANKASTDFPRILKEGNIPLVNCIQYKSIGIAVSNVMESYNYYNKLGFVAADQEELVKVLNGLPSKGKDILVLRSNRDLELHLIQADKPLEDNQNLLMDFPTYKPPGHTHASWSVCSVPGIKSYLSEQGISLSGTRNTLAGNHIIRNVGCYKNNS